MKHMVHKSRADNRGKGNMMPKDVNKVAAESMKGMKPTSDGRPPAVGSEK